MAQSISQEAIGATGLPGATAASRHAGATTSGAPTTGTFAVGDYVVDQTGAIYVCTVAGTPGTWKIVGTPPTALIAGKNKIINGDFGIWQRGTSFTNVYPGLVTCDRWYVASAETTGGTISRSTFTPGSAPVAGYEGQYFLTFLKGGTTADKMSLTQRVEDVRTFAGQTVTISYWMKGSASFTNEPLVQQNFGTGGSGEVYTVTATQSITTSWARYSVTIAVPSISGTTINANNFVSFWLLRYTGTSNITADIWGAQVEAGNLAGATPTTGCPTEFTTASGTVGGELALCQRYYQRWVSATAYSEFIMGMVDSTTVAIFAGTLSTTMRVAPSVSATNCSIYAGSAFSVGTITPRASANTAGFYCTTSGLTAYRPARLEDSGSNNGYIEFGSEL